MDGRALPLEKTLKEERGCDLWTVKNKTWVGFMHFKDIDILQFYSLIWERVRTLSSQSQKIMLITIYLNIITIYLNISQNMK